MDVREFSWVSNEAKALRAEKELKKMGVPVTEESIKALYLKYGGLCVGEPETQLGVDEGQITFPVLTEDEKKQVVEEAEKKTKRRR